LCRERGGVHSPLPHERDCTRAHADEVLDRELAAHRAARTAREAEELKSHPDAVLSRVRSHLSTARVDLRRITPHGRIHRLLGEECPISCGEKFCTAAHSFDEISCLLEQPYVSDLPADALLAITQEVRAALDEFETVRSQHRTIDEASRRYVDRRFSTLDQHCRVLHDRSMHLSASSVG